MIDDLSHRARGRGGAGGLDHRRGDQRARRGAPRAAQASTRAPLVVGGDRAARRGRRRGDRRDPADLQRRHAGRRQRPQGGGRSTADRHGGRAESATTTTPRATAEEDRNAGTGDRRQPDRHLLVDRALRHRRLRRDQVRPRPRRRPLRHREGAGHAEEDVDPAPPRPAGTPRSSPPRPARPKESKNGANRSPRSKAPTRPKKSSCTRRGRQVLPALVHQASPASDQEGRYQVEISDIKLFEARPRRARTRSCGRARGARWPGPPGGRRGRGRRGRRPRGAWRRRWSR